ncbi:hypothetical protein FNV43_RR13076 [Rhamnella rubrinervis]|uniref:DUF4371 domain-containing protein n=1 Tax=Rhamnella rubrinervis TaxID=2594499 RepID=A0A8K0H0G7_9ROSA|nr:hypothetical protein FNV43_RR13076 [Rhamnella rubrinervis]
MRSIGRHELLVENLRGQGYDGANMRGAWNGLQALFLQDCPYAYYVHCFAHRLQLALNGAKEVKALMTITDDHTTFLELLRRKWVTAGDLLSPQWSRSDTKPSPSSDPHADVVRPDIPTGKKKKTWCLYVTFMASQDEKSSVDPSLEIIDVMTGPNSKTVKTVAEAEAEVVAGAEIVEMVVKTEMVEEAERT